MVQMTPDGIQRLIDTFLIENTQGLVTATQVKEITSDMNDSYEPLVSNTIPPVVRNFSIQGQSLFVDAGTVISGNLTFLYNISQQGNVDGNLTLLQDAATLAADVDPTGTSRVQAVNTANLANGGDSTTFTLRGTATVAAGGATFEDSITVAALRDRDYVYISAEDDADPSDVVIANADRFAFQAGRQVITVPTFTGNKNLTILQRASEPPITALLSDNTNMLDAFPLTSDALIVDTAQFDALVSENLLLGSVWSGKQLTLVR
jgi:hypothetical protein